MNPKFCDNIDAGVDEQHQLHFVFVNARRHLTVQAEPDTVEVVSLMDGSRSLEQIHASLNGRVGLPQISSNWRREWRNSA